MPNKVEVSYAYRSRITEKMLGNSNTLIKRVYNLNVYAYTAKALDTRTEELPGPC